VTIMWDTRPRPRTKGRIYKAGDRWNFDVGAYLGDGAFRGPVQDFGSAESWDEAFRLCCDALRRAYRRGRRWRRR
jgi:hypothetical protein